MFRFALCILTVLALSFFEFQCSITLCPLYLSSCVCIPHLGFALPALFPALVVPCALLLDCVFVSSLVIQLNRFSFSQLSALPLIALMCICSCCIPFVRVSVPVPLVFLSPSVCFFIVYSVPLLDFCLPFGLLLTCL